MATPRRPVRERRRRAAPDTGPARETPARVPNARGRVVDAPNVDPAIIERLSDAFDQLVGNAELTDEQLRRFSRLMDRVPSEAGFSGKRCILTRGGHVRLVSQQTHMKWVLSFRDGDELLMHRRVAMTYLQIQPFDVHPCTTFLEHHSDPATCFETMLFWGGTNEVRGDYECHVINRCGDRELAAALHESIVYHIGMVTDNFTRVSDLQPDCITVTMSHG